MCIIQCGEADSRYNTRKVTPIMILYNFFHCKGFHAQPFRQLKYLRKKLSQKKIHRLKNLNLFHAISVRKLGHTITGKKWPLRRIATIFLQKTAIFYRCFSVSLGLEMDAYLQQIFYYGLQSHDAVTYSRNVLIRLMAANCKLPHKLSLPHPVCYATTVNHAIWWISRPLVLHMG